MFWFKNGTIFELSDIPGSSYVKYAYIVEASSGYILLVGVPGEYELSPIRYWVARIYLVGIIIKEQSGMKRYLITAKEFRDRQLDIHPRIERLTKEESVSLAHKVFPFFMDYINRKLVAQSGTGIVVNIHKVARALDIDSLASMNYDQGTFMESLAGLLHGKPYGHGHPVGRCYKGSGG